MKNTLSLRTKALYSLGILATLGTAATHIHAAPIKHPAPGIVWAKSKSGDRGETVRTLQYLLKARGYKVNADGIFGGSTKTAVLKFQRSRGLVADGVVGGKTWKALIVPVKRGSKGYGVRAVQNALASTDLDHKTPVDGVFGQKTEAAVKELQGAYAQKQDGIVGLTTWGLLLDEGGEGGDY